MPPPTAPHRAAHNPPCPLPVGLPTPAVGAAGLEYAATIRALADAKAWTRLVCHFYNFYFAHTAGGQVSN